MSYLLQSDRARELASIFDYYYIHSDEASLEGYRCCGFQNTHKAEPFVEDEHLYVPANSDPAIGFGLKSIGLRVHRNSNSDIIFFIKEDDTWKPTRDLDLVESRLLLAEFITFS